MPAPIQLRSDRAAVFARLALAYFALSFIGVTIYKYHLVPLSDESYALALNLNQIATSSLAVAGLVLLWKAARVRGFQ
ncbi:MAG: hypothetical protein M5R36_04335 [Deltaproteobacteria bacterium]|nr:hypothetical protein [Deltaproteobacteria bacterium]